MKQWLSLLFSGNPGVSSKRVFGGIGLIWMGILITISERDYIPEFMYICAGLLGLETIFQGLTRTSSHNANVKTGQALSPDPNNPPAPKSQDPPLDP